MKTGGARPFGRAPPVGFILLLPFKTPLVLVQGQAHGFRAFLIGFLLGGLRLAGALELVGVFRACPFGRDGGG